MLLNACDRFHSSNGVWIHSTLQVCQLLPASAEVVADRCAEPMAAGEYSVDALVGHQPLSTPLTHRARADAGAVKGALCAWAHPAGWGIARLSSTF